MTNLLHSVLLLERLDAVSFDELSDLGLSPANEDALVALTLTLSDGYMS